MKRLFFIAACLLLASSPAFAAKQTLNAADTGAQSRTKQNANFTELYDGKSDKTAVVRYWTDWPTTGPNNVLAVNTIVAYGGSFYKVTQELTKTGSTADPETLTAYFDEVTGGGDYTLPVATDTVLGGVKVGARLSITDGVLSADVQSGGESITVGDGTTGPFLDGTSDGGTLIKLYGPSTYWTALQAGAAVANRSWRLPIDAPPSAGTTRLMNMDEYGQMGFVDPATFATPTGSAASMTVVATGFDGNLATTDNTLQEIAQKVDDLNITGGSMVYPSAGVPNSTGSAWGTSYTVGTSANNLIQLNSSGQLPFTIDVSDLTDTDGLFTAKANTSCFASESAFNACFDLTWATGGSMYVSTPPTYSDETCTAGQYALSESYRYDCVASGNWNRTALTDWSNPTPTDGTPSAFTFTDVTDATLSTQYTALAQITGIDTGITCSGSGGTVAACTGATENTCGTFGSTSGTITNNQYVGARITSSGSNSTAVNNAVTCGGVSDTFTVTTQSGVTNIVTNGDFSSGSTSWTLAGTANVTGGKLVLPGAWQTALQGIAITNGVTYNYSFTISDFSGTSPTVALHVYNDNPGSFRFITTSGTAGTVSGTFTAQTADLAIRLANSSADSQLSVDNVVISAQ